MQVSIEELFQNLVCSKWSETYPCSTKLNSQVLSLSVVGNFLLPVGQAQPFGFLFTYYSLHQEVQSVVLFKYIKNLHIYFHFSCCPHDPRYSHPLWGFWQQSPIWSPSFALAAL